MCIWFTSKSLKVIESTLNVSIERIKNYCQHWGLKLNENKTLHTVFTTAGYRSNYETKYKLNLFLDNQRIPLEPFPTFLGIQFDPKLSFKNLYENIESRTASKINLIRRIKGLKLKNSLNLCRIVFKNFIRSIFDYAFIPLSCSTQKISSDIQKLQNKFLRHIKFFPIKTKIVEIHKQLKIELVETRSKNLLNKFLSKKTSHQQLRMDLDEFNQNNKNLNQKFYSLYQNFNHFIIPND